MQSFNIKATSLVMITVIMLMLNACSNRPSLSYPLEIDGITSLRDKPYHPINIDMKVRAQSLVQKIHTLHVIIDLSSNMRNHSDKGVRVDYTNDLLGYFQETLPFIDAELYVYASGGLFHDGTEKDTGVRILGPNNINSGLLTTAANRLRKIGLFSGLAETITQAEKNIAYLPGNHAVIILTNWSRVDNDVVAALNHLRASSERKICTHTIGIGNHYPYNRTLPYGACGSSHSTDQLTPFELARFTEHLLFSGPADTDLDGVYDYLDHCKNTRAGIPITDMGCPRKSLPVMGAMH